MPNNQLIVGDCAQHVTPVRCIVADPPDNIGLNYGEGVNDKLPLSTYYMRLASWIRVGIACSEVFWLSYNAIHELEVNNLIRFYAGGKELVRKIIWHYTFGSYTEKSFTSLYRPIWLVADKNDLYYDEVREESERMRLGDARSSGLKVPGDVWLYPRIVGNSKERRAFCPTQHPVALYDRVMKLSGGSTFVDLFAGSGTCFAAGRLNKSVEVTGYELDPVRAKNILRAFPEVSTF